MFVWCLSLMVSEKFWIFFFFFFFFFFFLFVCFFFFFFWGGGGPYITQPTPMVYKNMSSLWFFSLFGWFEEHVRWSGNTGERLLFSALWAGISILCIVLGSKLGQRVLRSYGLVFLIIDVYTFYFQFVVAHSAEAWFLHLLLTGGSLLAVGMWLERKLSGRAQ